MTEADTGVTRAQATVLRRPAATPRTRRCKDGLSPGSQRELGPAATLTSDLWLRTVRGDISVLDHPVYTSPRQPQEQTHHLKSAVSETELPAPPDIPISLTVAPSRRLRPPSLATPSVLLSLVPHVWAIRKVRRRLRQAVLSARPLLITSWDNHSDGGQLTPTMCKGLLTVLQIH